MDGTIDQNGDGLLDVPPPPGWSGNEYIDFVSIPMYNAGINDGSRPQMGNAFIAYDCVTSRLCVAAYLNDESYFGDETGGKNCIIERSDASSWVSIDGTKYHLPDATPSPLFGYQYVMFPDASYQPGGLRPIGKREYRALDIMMFP